VHEGASLDANMTPPSTSMLATGVQKLTQCIGIMYDAEFCFVNTTPQK
jgi:hypothetical protein